MERAPGAHSIGGWVSPRAIPDALVKRKIPIPLRELNLRTPIVQLVAQRHTDWAITAHICLYSKEKVKVSRWLIKQYAMKTYPEHN
jgi:hypothetical protein